ncbi:MAG: DNA polymerase III subunit delta, partial [Gemmatimonadales bacterium]
MPPQSRESLQAALTKGTLAGAYYFYGQEDLLKDEAIAAILDRALDPSLRDFNLDQRSAGQLDPEAVVTLCTTVPMMADRRVVVLREIEGWKRKPKVRAAVLAYLERPAPETVLILVQGAGEEADDKDLVRAARAVRFDPLPAEEAREWLAARAGTMGVSLTDDARDHLLRAVGGDLGAVAAELHKFAALPGGDPLTAEQVGKLVGIRHGETIFDWRDAVLDGASGRAVSLLGPLLDQPGVSAVRLLTMLGTTLIGIGIARARSDRGARGRALNDEVFAVVRASRIFGLLGWGEEAARWVRWAARWPSPRVAAALRAARDADRALKETMVSDERGILTDLILRMT